MMDLKQLRALAEAATPGPWHLTASRTGVIDSRREWVCNVVRITPETDVEFIAAANPQTVLALIDKIEWLIVNVEQLTVDKEAVHGAHRMRCIQRNEARGQLATVTRERDELRVKLADAQTIESLTVTIERLKSERDEARAEVEPLREACQKWENHFTNTPGVAAANAEIVSLRYQLAAMTAARDEACAIAKSLFDDAPGYKADRIAELRQVGKL